MSFKNSLRDRAIAAFIKHFKTTAVASDLEVWKSRSSKTVTVRLRGGWTALTWSYKNGGKLEKVA